MPEGGNHHINLLRFLKVTVVAAGGNYFDQHLNAAGILVVLLLTLCSFHLLIPLSLFSVSFSKVYKYIVYKIKLNLKNVTNTPTNLYVHLGY